jgi:hypothetical protein
MLFPTFHKDIIHKHQVFIKPTLGVARINDDKAKAETSSFCSSILGALVFCGKSLTREEFVANGDRNYAPFHCRKGLVADFCEINK